jgi:hypothetical protein
MPKRPLVALLVPVLALGLLPACEQDRGPLTVADLTRSEQRFVTRYVVLERARAVALAEPATGEVLLDSLRTAWGDTAAALAREDMPAAPARAAAVQDLLRRLLRAEADSLVHAPRPDRLDAPLPSPAAD